MPRTDPASRAAYLKDYRADPAAAELRRWHSRTMAAAWRELAAKHKGEFAAILWRVREADPRPESEPNDEAGEAA